MLDVMVILRVSRIDHAEPAFPMTDDDISKAVAEALEARFPKIIGWGPPVSVLDLKPRPSVVLSLQNARVMVVRPEALPEHANGTAESVPVGPRIVT